MAKKKAKAVEEVLDDGGEITITRSFSRKLNMAAHGGKQYETADLFCSVTKVVFSEDAEAESKLLDEFCKDEVQKTIDLIDGEVEEIEEADIKPKKKKKTLDVGVKIQQEEMEDMQDLINDLTMAKTAADLKEAVGKIKEAAADLSKDQKSYLSAYYTKRKEAIEE